MAGLRWERFAQLKKFDEFTGEFEAVMTDETPDGVDEVMDYATSKPYIEQWSQFFRDATDGNSVGNLRRMHQPHVAGHLANLVLDDGAKAVLIRGKITDSEDRKKAAHGDYTGVSMGGNYYKKWADPDNGRLTRYTAIPVEVSLVDYPCNPNATFSLLRGQGADRKEEMRKFIAKAKTKTVDGEEHPASDFGYVPDPDKPSTWKFPLFNESHVRAAVQMYAKGDIPADAKEGLKSKIRAAAKKYDIEIGEESEVAKWLAVLADGLVKAKQDERLTFLDGLKKSHWPIAWLANLAESLEYACQNADATEHPEVSQELEALRGEVLAVLERAASEEAAEYSEDGMDAAKVKEIEDGLERMHKLLAPGPLNKADEEANAHAEIKAKHHAQLAGLHQKMADHYAAGAKGAHEEPEDGEDKTKESMMAALAEVFTKAKGSTVDPNLVTKDDLKAFAAELVRNLFGPGAKVPFRADPAALKGMKVDEPAEVKTGDPVVDAKFKDPTVAFIRGRMARPMMFQTPGEVGYRNRDLLRR